MTAHAGEPESAAADSLEERVEELQDENAQLHDVMCSRVVVDQVLRS
ncbi:MULTISPECIES: hypothetical protein [Streptomyces]|nr:MULTISPECIES: hypothetical protein [Streptomyces]MYS96319.1 hypothetical protein [Streptomyces sp. SID5469]